MAVEGIPTIFEASNQQTCSCAKTTFMGLELCPCEDLPSQLLNGQSVTAVFR